MSVKPPEAPGVESHLAPQAGTRRGPFLLCLAFAAGCAGTGPGSEKAIFYPPPPEPPRLQYLTSFSSSRDVEVAANPLDKFLFGEDPKEKTILGPYGLAWHKGKIYVCDVAQAVVLRLDLAAGKFEAVGRGGAGSLQKPINIAIDERGHKYVADHDRARVIVFGPDDAHLATFGQPGQFRPTDVLVDGNDLYVCDISQNEVEVLDRDSGAVRRSIQPKNDEPGFLRKPTNLALDGGRNLYVVDTIDCRVTVFDPAGKFLRYIGAAGDVAGQFARPKGIAVDRAGFVYVVDAAFENCQIFDPKGEIALSFGGPGDVPGTMVLPTKVAVSEEGLDFFTRYAAPEFKLQYLVFVVNQYGPRKVNVYGFGRSAKHQYPE